MDSPYTSEDEAKLRAIARLPVKFFRKSSYAQNRTPSPTARIPTKSWNVGQPNNEDMATAPGYQSSSSVLGARGPRFGPLSTPKFSGRPQRSSAYVQRESEGSYYDPTLDYSVGQGRSRRASSSSSCEITFERPVTLNGTAGSRHGQGPEFGDSHSTTIAPPDLPTETWDQARDFHNGLFYRESDHIGVQAQDAGLEEIKTTPLFSAQTLQVVLNNGIKLGGGEIFPSYGLLAKRSVAYEPEIPIVNNDDFGNATIYDGRLFLNTNAPWSTFICGSQGSGKSHTLSCILENGLLPHSGLGELPKQLAAIVFHYDKFTGSSSSQMCEAAYLSSKGIPVNVLVSPTNYWTMSRMYRSLEGVPASSQPKVAPLFLGSQQLNIERMMKLMAFDHTKAEVPLYMEVVRRILRDIAMDKQGAPGLDYEDFIQRLSCESFNPTQRSMIDVRLQLLENFMQPMDTPGAAPSAPPAQLTGKGRVTRSKAREGERNKNDRNKNERINNKEKLRNQKASIAKQGIYSFPAGSLTIVDLSCPFVDESAACALFNICLSIFLEHRQDIGRIVALDEAHKFMNENSNASALTESLLSIIRQQRHLATRVVIATQEPTISPKLLDLTSMTIVHRFSSRVWLTTLKAHLAGASYADDEAIFNAIVALQAGEALLFSPSAIMDIEVTTDADGSLALKAQKLGKEYIKVGVRKRLTADGGRSMMAT